jgi:hypothetical protein
MYHHSHFWKSEIFFILGLDNHFRKSELICPSGYFVAPATLKSSLQAARLVTDTGYVGLEVSVGGYGFAVWATGGSVCGSVITPKNPTGTPGHCTP